MPRWRALPDELDPQVREFASQLRRLVDRSGLSIAAVADRTGYSKTSWERYLNGRLLAPKGAIVALAEVTGTNPMHLTTMWELAERAWSRSEMRHDMTMEAIRISQARAALGEFGAPPANGSGGKQARKGGSATVTPGVAGPAGVSPTVPPQPSAADAEDSSGGGSSRGASPHAASSQGTWSREAPSYGGGSSGGGSSGGAGRGGGWGVVATPSSGGAGQFGPTGPSGPSSPVGVASSAGSAGAAGGPPRDARPSGGGGGSPDGARRKRRLTMFLAGVVGALVVVAAAVYLTRGDDTKDESKPETPTTSVAAPDPELPAGVNCSGADCTGKDPENMGCGGELATTATSVTVGTTLVEVRYSETCAAAWARITQAAVGDTVEVSSGTAAKQTGSVDADTDAYTPMVAVKDAGDAKACATLASGETGCTQ
ncbi:XRE family transcriptional regulator [Streptomyces sp. NBC_00554]|uniref:XRE family transcriptional regulator n=1 Tax=Streptomyces sp. NBC_00554 TaxID=2903661 RepID=UPI00352E9116|nr:XRE family transcriptional regulator [Streptomyces sp. NBC_00554]